MVLPSIFRSLTTPATTKPNSIVGIGGHLGEHIISGSGAGTMASLCEAAVVEVVPMVAVARDPYSELVSNRSLRQEDRAWLLASVVHSLNSGGALPKMKKDMNDGGWSEVG
ncbi:unnamed protein product [Lactuca saligna]|uniref:Uncharacterized protein n=1 Tax=Lactuca saligna TaxID=75948 RepID=A0AA35Z7R2_LACSI|nr:unnamed protein product [Lactuca saligna]